MSVAGAWEDCGWSLGRLWLELGVSVAGAWGECGWSLG